MKEFFKKAVEGLPSLLSNFSRHALVNWIKGLSIKYIISRLFGVIGGWKLWAAMKSLGYGFDKFVKPYLYLGIRKVKKYFRKKKYKKKAEDIKNAEDLDDLSDEFRDMP